ncbi:hypothetical protein [Legionella drancourtii]|uniref:Uncharacterized protein n=1 Tax=Legionella drancourtii LLAP12 TaxID=658187 RepID=G9ETI6_9GAMM|nr:hypothetical protein [Legionella drancourtii]EHL29653.1 hypothetical protein LDG_8618 [Legionella drancourtii LLAP12]
MGASMFSINKGVGLSQAANSEIIRKLTALRITGYKDALINQEINEDDEAALNKLTLHLGEKILKVNLIGADGTDAYKAARSQFKRIIEQLSKTKLSLIVFAAQLLQFYTIICAEQFKPEGDYQEFQQLLANGSNKFGAVNTNLFIIEYQLIKIYNDSVALEDANANADALAKEALAHLNLIETQLPRLKESLDQLVIAEPDNVFLHYLLFLHSYTSAKLLELHYILEEKNLSTEEILALSGRQEIYLKAAKDALDTIEQLKQFFKAYKKNYAKGLEFALGQDLLHNLPEHDFHEIRNHLLSLITTNSSSP